MRLEKRGNERKIKRRPRIIHEEDYDDYRTVPAGLYIERSRDESRVSWVLPGIVRCFPWGKTRRTKKVKNMEWKWVRETERRELVVCISSFTWDKAIPEALIHRSFNNEMQYLICGNLMVCEASLLWYPSFVILAHRRRREWNRHRCRC